MANTRPRKAKPAASSPLSSAPSSPPSMSSPSSAPSSPYNPRHASKKATEKTYMSKRARKAKESVAKVAQIKAVGASSTSPPPASLDDLLGSMDEDREIKRRRDTSRLKTLSLIDSAPSSQTNASPKRQPKKRKRPEEEDKEENEKHPSKKHSPSPSKLEEDEDAKRPSKDHSRVRSVTPTTITAPASPLSTPRPRTRRSTSAIYVSDEEDEGDDEELDLGAALNRHNATLLTADLFDNDDLSDPPTPKAQKWKKTVHPGVGPGDTCLVKYRRHWFPAKLLRMDLAESADSRDIYEVQTQDGIVYHPTRRGILFLYEGEAMAKVTMGDYKITAAHKGGPTSVILSDDATEHERFGALPLSEQIGKLHEHLGDLAADRYLPAMWRINAFHQGKVERLRLKEELAFGDLKNMEVEQASSILSEWVRDHEGVGRFKALAPDERSQFASFVLLPEIIIAICIRSLNLDLPSSWVCARGDMPPPEEGTEAEAARLYDLARKKLVELGENDHENEWTKRRHDVKMAVQWAGPAVTGSPEPEKPIRHRAARRLNREEASLQVQERLLESFARKRAKRKTVANAEAAESSSASTEPTLTNGQEVVEGTTSATEAEACNIEGGGRPGED